MDWQRFAAIVLSAALVGACTSGGDDEATPEDAPSPPAEATAVASDGCDVVEPAATVTEEPQRVDLESGGEERWYLQQVPSAAAEGTPLPLVVDIHGYSEGADVHVAMSALDVTGEEHGFITVFPHGDAGGRVIPGWDVGFDGPDLVFFGDLLDHVEDTLCVDTDRIYVTGLSNGAFMTSAIACAYADRVAAVAPVAGVRPVEPCDRGRPVPMVAFHGTDDDYVAFDGGFGSAVAELPTPDGTGTLGDGAPEEDPGPQGPSIPEIVAGWAELDGCDPEPREERVADDVLHVVYDCPDGAAVELYVIEEGGHAWPGSDLSAAVEGVVGRTTFSISANEVMWEHFAAHPRSGG